MKKALIATALLFGCAGQTLAVGGIADVTVYDRAESRTLPVHYPGAVCAGSALKFQ